MATQAPEADAQLPHSAYAPPPIVARTKATEAKFDENGEEVVDG